MRTDLTRTSLVPSALVVSALLLGGCGGDAEPGTTGGPAAGTSATTSSATTPDSATATGSGSGSGSASTADVEFVTGMIPHHGQAIEMADLATDRARNPQVKKLAARVRAAQAPEIESLTALLTAWGRPVPAATGHSDSMAGMDHGDSSMMTAEQMAELEAATGAAFDRRWVDLMIAHHEGAVRMSDEQIRAGSHPEARRLAEAVADAQTREIAELRSLRADLG